MHRRLPTQKGYIVTEKSIFNMFRNCLSKHSSHKMISPQDSSGVSLELCAATWFIIEIEQRTNTKWGAVFDSKPPVKEIGLVYSRLKVTHALLFWMRNCYWLKGRIENPVLQSACFFTTSQLLPNSFLIFIHCKFDWTAAFLNYFVLKFVSMEFWYSKMMRLFKIGWLSVSFVVGQKLYLLLTLVQLDGWQLNTHIDLSFWQLYQAHF